MSDKKLSALTHRIVAAAMSNHQCAEFTDARIMAGEIWDKIDAQDLYDHSVAKSGYDSSASLDDRVSQADAIVKVWQRIRGRCLHQGILLDFPATVIDISSLTSADATAINTVYNRLEAKLKGGKKPSNSDEMYSEFKVELEQAEESGHVPSKFGKSNAAGSYLSRMVVKAKQKADSDVLSRMERLIDGNLIPEAWLTALNTSGSKTAASANKFMIDYLVCPLVGFKMCGFTLQDTMSFLDALSKFSFSQDVSRDAQKHWWHSVGYKYWPIRSLMHESFTSLYENPAKLTFSRMMDTASALFPTASSLGPLFLRDDPIKLKLIADICKHTIAHSGLSTTDDDTSAAEHLVHQLLVTGAKPFVHYNKNSLTQSAAGKVKFTTGASSTSGVVLSARRKPVKGVRYTVATPRKCLKFSVASAMLKFDLKQTTKPVESQLLSELERSHNVDVLNRISASDLVDVVFDQDNCGFNSLVAKPSAADKTKLKALLSL